MIHEDSGGQLWILSGVNAFLYDRKTKKFSLSPFTSKSNNLLFTDMAEDDNCNIWFAMNERICLYRYDTGTQKIWSPPQINSSLLYLLLFF